MLRSLKSLYENVKCTVRVNGVHSEWFDVNTGLKQGCVLSPLFFNAFVNDLTLGINSLNCGIPVSFPVKSAVQISRTYVRAKCEFARIHNLFTVKMHGLYSCGFNASMSVRNSQGVAPIMTSCQHANMEFALDGLHTILAYFVRMISTNNSYNSHPSLVSTIIVTA